MANKMPNNVRVFTSEEVERVLHEKLPGEEEEEPWDRFAELDLAEGNELNLTRRTKKAADPAQQQGAAKGSSRGRAKGGGKRDGAPGLARGAARYA